MLMGRETPYISRFQDPTEIAHHMRIDNQQMRQVFYNTMINMVHVGGPWTLFAVHIGDFEDVFL
jgi:hypothetical protein